MQTTSTQKADVSTDDMAEKFRDRIESAETLEDATTVGNDINAAKPALGTALFPELKNKATRRYHLVKHRSLIDEAINALPQLGKPDATTRFEELEKKLTAAKRYLGDELHDKYCITLDDMKIWVVVVNRHKSYVATAMTGMRRLRTLPGQLN